MKKMSKPKFERRGFEGEGVRIATTIPGISKIANVFFIKWLVLTQ